LLLPSISFCEFINGNVNDIALNNFIHTSDQAGIRIREKPYWSPSNMRAYVRS
jgi:hypothetical protein